MRRVASLLVIDGRSRIAAAAEGIHGVAWGESPWFPDEAGPSRSSPPVDISGPRFTCGVGVEEGDLVAVAECVRD
jgi:hypothetical protein